MTAQYPRRRTVRRIFAFVIALLVLWLARPTFHLLRTAWHDQDQRQPAPVGQVDDASRLNATPIVEVWPVPQENGQAERQLVELLSRARRDGLPVSIAGARHSMGGHTIAADGIVINMRPLRSMRLNDDGTLLTVGAGALWSEILPFLDEHGRSIRIMQTNNSFSVGGSVSVNCHGWQYGCPPIASTVRSLRVMTADGVIHDCSRDRNSELFSLVLGGYGLFGVILDVTLEVDENELYTVERTLVPIGQFVSEFEERGAAPDAVMAYGRLSIVPGELFDEAVVTVMVRNSASHEPVPAISEPGLIGLRRTIFRGSVSDDYGKRLRWQTESRLQELVTGRTFSRNHLLNESVTVFENRTDATTDILHEYFVPAETFLEFVGELRRAVEELDADLLNVTVRDVRTDHDTFLRYAEGDMLALVLLFVQDRSDAGEMAMRDLTRRLIDAAHDAGGRYYLPYRLHATQEQFLTAYPQAPRFFELKRQYDLEELFRNEFYEQYGR